MRLLLVEDDPMIGEAVQDLLRAEHYAVDWVRDGDAADTALRASAYDLVMLDLGLQTVRSYRKTMMKKLSVNNVAGLTQLALSAGLTRFPTTGAPATE